MKLAIIFSESRLSGKLTKFFTGCHAYHCCWVDDNEDFMYDMHLLRRKRYWPYYKESQVKLFNFPEVKKSYLEEQLLSDSSRYGFIDYLLFAARPLYHLLGKSTRNAKGVICSEMINLDMRNSDVDTPWRSFDPPPSPCDLVKWLVNLDRENHEQ